MNDELLCREIIGADVFTKNKERKTKRRANSQVAWRFDRDTSDTRRNFVHELLLPYQSILEEVPKSNMPGVRSG